MGTHPSGPSKLLDGRYFLDHLREKPDDVGIVPAGYESSDLPYLFKVLSIQTALSIQVCLYLMNSTEEAFRPRWNFRRTPINF